eukprot:347160-Chlamydomonas_euryale.AAC.2
MQLCASSPASRSNMHPSFGWHLGTAKVEVCVLATEIMFRNAPSVLLSGPSALKRTHKECTISPATAHSTAALQTP